MRLKMKGNIIKKKKDKMNIMCLQIEECEKVT